MPRRLHLAVLAAVGISALPATAIAQRAPSFATPTTTTTTTTTPGFVSATTTTSPVIVNPATTTTRPGLVTPTTTATTPPGLVTPTTTTTLPVIVNPATTVAVDDLAQPIAPGHDGVGADVPLGVIDISGDIPEDVDLTTFPGAPEGPTPVGDGPTFTAGLSCAYQCIRSGVAYPRGFGALLVVETHVPAQIFISVVDADSDPVGFTNSPGMATEFSFALDHLEPGRTYLAMAAATDENGDTSYAWGEFFTLSQRTVEITIGSPTVSGGPTNIVDTDVWLRTADLDFLLVAVEDTIVYYSLPRHTDLGLFVFRTWATSQSTICEGVIAPGALGPQGDDDGLCGCWNSASLEIDLDVVPAGETSWTSATIDAPFSSAAGGDPLPDGYGDPRFFHFSAPVTVGVSYS